MWTPDERRFLRSLNSAHKIQDHLDQLVYNAQDEALSPRWVMLTNDGHCLEGCLLAAAALEFHGHKPLVVDLVAHNDDHHVIAVYRGKNGWGSIGKSNTTLLRGRQPYYQSIRELVMSYFDFYFNTQRQFSLYAYSNPINLNRYNRLNWRTSDEDLKEMGMSFSDLTHYELASISELERLPKVKPNLLAASLLGSDRSGLYKA